ncbi:hypothetical protein H0H92_013895, partial [Tricholoma furcatifolium]
VTLVTALCRIYYFVKKVTGHNMCRTVRNATVNSRAKYGSHNITAVLEVVGNLTTNVYNLTPSVQNLTADIRNITADVRNITADVRNLTTDIQSLTTRVDEGLANDLVMRAEIYNLRIISCNARTHPNSYTPLKKT